MNTNLLEHINRSPYSMVYEAREIMTKMIIEISRIKEIKVIELLNAASTYPNMSKYQLATTRIILADIYYSHKIYGSAYEHYKIALNDYPKAPVKKKLEELEKMKFSDPDSFIFSLDTNIVNINICYKHTIKKQDDQQNCQITIHNRSISEGQAKQDMEILRDSLKLVNNSNNLDTVLSCYNIAIKTLEKLSFFENDELNKMGLLLEKPFPDILKTIQDNKINLFNQAITRNLKHDINLTTKNEIKVKKIMQFRNEYENNLLLFPENKTFLNEQCTAEISKYTP